MVHFGFLFDWLGWSFKEGLVIAICQICSGSGGMHVLWKQSGKSKAQQFCYRLVIGLIE